MLQETKCKVIQSYSSAECNEFEIFSNDEKISYFVEHFVNPETNERLENTVFEVYYDYDSEFDECLASMIFDEFDDFAEFNDDYVLYNLCHGKYSILLEYLSF